MIRALALLLAGAAVFAAAVIWAATRLPIDGVAVHVDAHGVVNGYESRARAVVQFATVGAVLTGLGLVMVAAVRWLPVRWLPVRLINVPHKDHWSEPQRLPLFRRMLVWDMAVLFSLPLLGLSYLPGDVTLLTLDPAGHNQIWLPVIVGVMMVALFAYIAWMVIGRYRPGA
jgi:hypothetical protein